MQDTQRDRANKRINFGPDTDHQQFHHELKELSLTPGFKKIINGEEAAPIPRSNMILTKKELNKFLKTVAEEFKPPLDISYITKQNGEVFMNYKDGEIEEEIKIGCRYTDDLYDIEVTAISNFADSLHEANEE